MVDNQINQNQVRIKTIEEKLNDDTILRQAEIKVRESYANLQTLQSQLKHSETEVESQRIKIQYNNQSLYSGKIHNPKELQDLQNESQALQRHLTTLEDKQIDLMIETEDASSTYETIKTAYEHLITDNAELSTQYKKDITIIQNDLSRLFGERQAIINSIPYDTLGLYESLREKRGGTAVALVSDNACNACGTILSATLLRTARIPNQLSYCDLCGRILYVT